MNLKCVVVGSAEVAAKFEKDKEDIQKAMRAGVSRAALLVVKRSKEKLSDDVLKVRTGRLRRSMTMRLTEQPGKVEGIVGTVVSYGRTHEFGFTGIVNIREHLRKAKQEAVRVRAHTRNMKLPERSFLRSALRELTPEINDAFGAVLEEKFKIKR